MFTFSTVVRALGDDNRLRILMALRQRPLCVCEITTLLGLAASTTSKHLFVLREAHLIESIKKGRWVYYRLPQIPTPCVHDALAWATRELEGCPQILQDEAALPGISHNANIHEFLKQKHIRVPADEPDDSEAPETVHNHTI
jgi:DNA-binding transcriptional ArsR family regulator